MTNISLKLPEALASRLTEEARKRHATKSDVVRDCLEAVLVRGEAAAKPSFHDLAKHHVRGFKGPRDLATNPKYMEGFGQ